MCMNTSGLIPYQSKRPRLKVPKLHRKILPKKAKENMVTKYMEMENLKLFMENQTIIEENKKLRKKALLLHRENRELHTQLSLSTKISTNT